MRLGILLCIYLLPMGLISAERTCYVPRSQLGLTSCRSYSTGNSSWVESRSTKYVLEDMYKGEDFLEQWDFFTGPDPTHGNVDFQSKDDALAKGLAVVQKDGTLTLSVDSTSKVPVGGNRASVRISSNKAYSGGLFIASVGSLPHGCSLWPAYWSVGPNWPTSGEIDIIEGVNLDSQNHMTLHTSPGCTLSTAQKTVLSDVVTTQCESSDGNNNGCSYTDASTSSFGHEFNKQGGGVYAHLWNGAGIAIWRWDNNTVPDDITNQNPDPSNWGVPAAFWSFETCNSDHFSNHSLIFDITICGDWAGASYGSDGCPGTCAEAVADLSNYRFANWNIYSVAVYQPS